LDVKNGEKALIIGSSGSSWL